MNESARELDQPLVEQITGSLAFGKPKLFQHIMSFVKKLAVEALEIAEIMGIHPLPLATGDQRGDFGAFVTHAGTIAVEAGLPSREFARAGEMRH